MLKSEHYKNNIPRFSLEKVVVGAYYDEEMQRKIHRFKFVHNHVDRVYFEELFASMKQEFPYQPDIIIYPPISLRDRIFRWPNHAKILTKYFFPGDIPVLSPFQKKFFTTHQSRRSKKERKGVRDEYVFDEKYRDQIKNKKILLIDDVITTGYTAHTLGSFLQKAGATEIVWFFLASERV